MSSTKVIKRYGRRWYSIAAYNDEATYCYGAEYEAIRYSCYLDALYRVQDVSLHMVSDATSADLDEDEEGIDLDEGEGDPSDGIDLGEESCALYALAEIVQADVERRGLTHEDYRISECQPYSLDLIETINGLAWLASEPGAAYGATIGGAG